MNKYSYIGECNAYGAWAVFYGIDDGVLLSRGSSWFEVGCKIKENGFDAVDQRKPDWRAEKMTVQEIEENIETVLEKLKDAEESVLNFSGILGMLRMELREAKESE